LIQGVLERDPDGWFAVSIHEITNGDQERPVAKEMVREVGFGDLLWVEAGRDKRAVILWESLEFAF
jgi:hypothetical protein